MSQLEDLGKAAGLVIDHYMSVGCPCRFPRFRALMARDSRDLGVPAVASPEQALLMQQFDRAVVLEDKKTNGPVSEGRCAKCSSHVLRWGEELAMSSWIEYLKITLAEGTEELGSPVMGPIPRCSDFFGAAAGVTRDDLAVMNQAYPRISIDDWVGWLCAERTP